MGKINKAMMFCSDNDGVFGIPVDIPLKPPIHGMKIYFKGVTSYGGFSFLANSTA